MAVGRAAAKAEEMGIPSFIVTRRGFTQVVNNAFASMGFPPEAPTVVEFPIRMFDSGSDLTPLEENVDEIIYGLTRWEPKANEPTVMAPPRIVVQGRDYQEALDNMNLLFLRNGWSDGLPLTAATEERVNWILTGTEVRRDTMVGNIMPRGGIATVETIAVTLAMAGGRPEYLPVLIAAVEAMVVPEQRNFHCNATTNSCYPVVIVNGPVARQIRLNSGYGCLGPSSEYPAGGVIGRALRLLALNVGGSTPGIGSMSIHGGPARYANIVFAEDEEGLPPGWKSLNVSYWGHPEGSNSVTFHNVSSTNNINLSKGIADWAGTSLNRIAGYMRVPNANYYFLNTYEGSPGIVLLARNTALTLAELGWSKDKLKAFFWEKSMIPWSEVEKVGFEPRADAQGIRRGDPLPITRKPENIMIVVAGGIQSGHAYWMQIGVSGLPTSAKIQLPASWPELLKQAEKDLGPLPPL